MIVEIHGASFENKGAALMLQATLTELRKRVPQVMGTLDPFFCRFDERSRLGVRQIFPSRGTVREPAFRKKFSRQKLWARPFCFKLFSQAAGIFHERYGLSGLHQISALIDISGFLFSSQWGDLPSRQFADLAAYYHSRGKKVMLLPQAFGPFETPAIREAFKRIIQNSDLICPRDEDSLKHLQSLKLSAAEEARIFPAPDITLNTEAPMPFERKVSLVPNARMTDRGGPEWKDRYTGWMRKILEFLLSKKIPVQIVLHERSEGDENLIKHLWPEGLPAEVAVVRRDLPENVKKTVAASWLTVGSRYHALAGALSCGTPAVGFGWAHKYRGLFQDFNCPELCFGPEQELPAVLRKIEELLEPAVRDQYRQKLIAARQPLDTRLESLWRRVSEMLLEKNLRAV